jgi:oligopeptide transport system permease protein
MVLLIARRLVQLPLIIAVVFAVSFALVWMVPGNPLERPEGQRPPVEVQEAMLRQYNLHSPWAFAGGYVGGLILRGDLGPSLEYNDQRVSEIVLSALPVSMALGAAALVTALVLGVGAAVAGALRPGWLGGSGSGVLAVVGVSLPSFVVGSVLLLVFAGGLRWLPVGGWGSVRQMVLPVVTLSLAPGAYIARLAKSGLEEAMRSEFARAARGKGASNSRVVLKHCLKVAMLPVLSFVGPAAAATLTGSFVVEQVFAIPGLGAHFVRAVLSKDQFLLLGVVLVYSAMLVVFNLVVDVLYAWVDPRIEVG